MINGERNIHPHIIILVIKGLYVRQNYIKKVFNFILLKPLLDRTKGEEVEGSNFTSASDNRKEKFIFKYVRYLLNTSGTHENTDCDLGWNARQKNNRRG